MSNPIILDGKYLAEKIKKDLKEKVSQLHRNPGLAVVMIGDNQASEIYVKNKKKDCIECGFDISIHRFKTYSKEQDITRLIQKLNNDETIDGIIVQLPLPSHYDTQKILQSVRSSKDIDGFTLANTGKLYAGVPGISPCTPAGIMRLLSHYNADLTGKHCTIVGRSDVVGKPLSYMMLQKNATVTICHSKTPKNVLAQMIQTSDIFVSAVGNPNYLWKELKKYPKVLIDVGINRVNGKLQGDIPVEWQEHCEAYTPVPGGVGPMTRAMLMHNLYMASKSRQERHRER